MAIVVKKETGMSDTQLINLFTKKSIVELTEAKFKRFHIDNNKKKEEKEKFKRDLNKQYNKKNEN